MRTAHAVDLATAADDVLRGLHTLPKTLPCRLLWDARGAALFARICTLDDYYLTRHELELLHAHLPAICAHAGPSARVIEPGSGLAQKTRLLLDALVAPSVYVPIDVEAAQLASAGADLRAAYPGLEVAAIVADYMRPFELPATSRGFERTLVFFPGSTIGNFELDEAEAFLARFGRIAGDRAVLVLGADSSADADALVRAYDDREGVTAEFDRNVLLHVNRAYAADFDPCTFVHRAVWNAQASRIEMQLVSLCDQRVQVAGETIELGGGEPIVTEHCYKYAPDVLVSLLGAAGWTVRDTFVDPRGWMRLWLCTRT